MKKFILSFIFFAFLANVSAQLKVNTSGDVIASKNIYLGSSSNFLGTTTDVPLIFKVNNVFAGFTGSSANSSVSFGYGSLNSSTGCCNVAVGVKTLYYNNTGFSNVANGYNSLYGNTSGSNNTASGAYALGSNATGSNNTAIGSYAGVSIGYLDNTTAIGSGATATASNQVVIGNSTVTSILGYNGVSIISDGRAKKNIRSEVPGLSFINLLQPITYNLDLNAIDELQKSDDPKANAFRDSIRMTRSPEEKEIEAKARANKEKIVYSGFIAQDVEKAARSVEYDFSGVDAPENGKGAYSLRYSDFIVPLVKAVQELSAQNEQLQRQINELKGNGVALRSSTTETGTTGIVNTVAVQCKLYQNAPNPFTQDTKISFYIPDNVNTASLNIYDLQGKQLMQFTITQRGESSHVISGHHFAAGMYLYALIVDGTVIDSKKMVLTK